MISCKNTQSFWRISQNLTDDSLHPDLAWRFWQPLGEPCFVWPGISRVVMAETDLRVGLQGFLIGNCSYQPLQGKQMRLLYSLELGIRYFVRNSRYE